VREILHPLKKEDLAYGSFIRGKVIRHLKQSKSIDTDFIIRNGFWGGSEPDKQKIREEYRRNLLGSAYAFVTRGAGNFSYRLYEVLSCGRIPVFVNNDSVLPLENLIDWRKHLIWVEEKDISKLDKILLAYHNRISEKDFMALQKTNRRLYETHLSPCGFYRHLHTLV
jgi:hypothetical protein